MRIVVVAPALAGSRWLECVLGTVCALNVVPPPRAEEDPEAVAFAAWAKEGFPDGSIVSHTYMYSPEVADAMASLPAHIVTIVRDPYDLFVAAHREAQPVTGRKARRTREGRRDHARGDWADAMVGKPLDDPVVLGLLAERFGATLMPLVEWRESGRAEVVRSEELERAPAAAVNGLALTAEKVAPDRIEAAMSVCRTPQARQAVRFGAAGAGGTSQGSMSLTEAHLRIFRDHHAELVRRLGYEVR